MQEQLKPNRFTLSDISLSYIFKSLRKYLPFLLILIYSTLALIKISFPGLHYDELLFGNLALGGLDGTFIHKKIFKIPVMVMAYIGALKSYLYFPIFKLFKPSYLSVRLPTILLTGLSLWLIFDTVKKRAGETIALLSLLFLVADPSFIALTRADQGPVVLSLFFRALTLFCFFRYLESKRKIYMGGVVLSLALGFYNKLDFIWFANSFLLSAAIFYSGYFKIDVLREFLSARWGKLVAGGCLLLVIFSLVQLIRLGIIQELNLLPSTSHIKIVSTNLLELLDGTSFYELTYGPANIKHYLGWSLWAILLSGSIVRWRQPATPLRTFHLFLLLNLALIVLQLLLTEKAIAPWHAFMIYPMTTLMLSSSLVALAEMLLPQKELLRRVALATVALLIFSFQLYVHTQYIRAYEQPYRNIAWSKKIDDLLDYTHSVPNRFVSIDWGIHNQLLVLTGQKGKYSELCFSINDPLKPEHEKQVVTQFFRRENAYLFILHGEETTMPAFMPARKQFFALAERYGQHPNKVHTIIEGGKVLFEIYELE